MQQCGFGVRNVHSEGAVVNTISCSSDGMVCALSNRQVLVSHPSSSGGKGGGDVVGGSAGTGTDAVQLLSFMVSRSVHLVDEEQGSSDCSRRGGLYNMEGEKTHGFIHASWGPTVGGSLGGSLLSLGVSNGAFFIVKPGSLAPLTFDAMCCSSRRSHDVLDRNNGNEFVDKDEIQGDNVGSGSVDSTMSGSSTCSVRSLGLECVVDISSKRGQVPNSQVLGRITHMAWSDRVHTDPSDSSWLLFAVADDEGLVQLWGLSCDESGSIVEVNMCATYKCTTMLVSSLFVVSCSDDTGAGVVVGYASGELEYIRADNLDFKSRGKAPSASVDMVQRWSCSPFSLGRPIRFMTKLVMSQAVVFLCFVSGSEICLVDLPLDDHSDSAPRMHVQRLHGQYITGICVAQELGQLEKVVRSCSCDGSVALWDIDVESSELVPRGLCDHVPMGAETATKTGVCTDPGGDFFITSFSVHTSNESRALFGGDGDIEGAGHLCTWFEPTATATDVLTGMSQYLKYTIASPLAHPHLSLSYFPLVFLRSVFAATHWYPKVASGMNVLGPFLPSDNIRVVPAGSALETYVSKTDPSLFSGPPLPARTHQLLLDFTRTLAEMLPALLMRLGGYEEYPGEGDGEEAPHIRILRMSFWSPVTATPGTMDIIFLMWQRVYGVLAAFDTAYGAQVYDDGIADGSYPWLGPPELTKGLEWRDVLQIVILARHAINAIEGFVSLKEEDASYQVDTAEKSMLLRLIDIAECYSNLSKGTHFSVSTAMALVAAKTHLGVTETPPIDMVCPVCGEDTPHGPNLLHVNCSACLISFSRDLLSAELIDCSSQNLRECTMCDYVFVPAFSHIKSETKTTSVGTEAGTSGRCGRYRWLPDELVGTSHCHLCRSITVASRDR